MTGTEFKCKKITKKKSVGTSLLSTDHILLLPVRALGVVMAKGKRGFKFTTGELEALAESVEELVPISTTEWERVWDQHIARYPDQQRTLESLKRKFQELARAKIKTGDPNMPRHIRVAKRAYYAIVKKTDGSTGGGIRRFHLWGQK